MLETAKKDYARFTGPEGRNADRAASVLHGSLVAGANVVKFCASAASSPVDLLYAGMTVFSSGAFARQDHSERSAAYYLQYAGNNIVQLAASANAASAMCGEMPSLFGYSSSDVTMTIAAVGLLMQGLGDSVQTAERLNERDVVSIY